MQWPLLLVTVRATFQKTACRAKNKRNIVAILLLTGQKRKQTM